MSEIASPPPNRRHPATWSPGQLDLVADLIDARWGPYDVSRPKHILDPMAGEGGTFELETLMQFRCRNVEVECSDIHRWQHARPGVTVANAANLRHASHSVDVIATSIPYGNRMADRLSTDGDGRVTYADRRGTNASAEDVSGMQWGREYRHAMGRIFSEWARVLTGQGVVVMACKDHVRGGQQQHVCAWVMREMRYRCFVMVDFRLLPVAGVRGVANSEARVPVEMVMCFGRAR